MSARSPTTVSVILTVFLLVLLAVLSLLLQMIALNGASERQGLNAMGISLACQGVVIMLLGIFAARVTRFLISRVDWNSILAVAATVLVATTIGGAFSFLAAVISIPVAGIR
jgi:uncharacterized membrane protein